MEDREITVEDRGLQGGGEDLFSEPQVKNPRLHRVRRLEEEIQRQNGIEKERSRRIRQQQEYIDKMSLSVDKNLRSTREEQRFNEEFEARIRSEVYRMHGISEDKLTGMAEYRNAWYRGAAFSLFFLSLVLFFLCGVLHGAGSEICIFMAFYTALEGTLLSAAKRGASVFDVFLKVLYLLLFPVMLTVFVCYELGFTEYAVLVPVFTAAGVVVLILGTASYFLYDPYRADRRNRKKADGYLKDMEKVALKEVRRKEKASGRLEKKKEKAAAKQQKKEQKKIERQQKKEQRKKERDEKKEQREKEGAMLVCVEEPGAGGVAEFAEKTGGEENAKIPEPAAGVEDAENGTAGS